ncbi:hypothetical protein L2725_12825 [Shewanella corallii]|uniref:Uncharacterized protein n=1 Tax=Shewanella corallii TaxID=560080 RepID=A0ABT0N872_9GAMM|nr:hypothetical protein [Shewanella corallii]MCL2914652.1 hypothetical protein [Shewanella corallii]
MDIRKPIFILLAIAISFPLYANSYSGPRTIKSIGCHKRDNICFIEIDGAAVGPSGCHATSVRFETEKEIAGKSAFSLFTAAYFSGKRVNLKVSETCFQYQTNFPTYDWFYIVD